MLVARLPAGHIVVDTFGLLLVVLVTAASVQEDRDGGAWVLDRLRFRMPSVVVVWADGGDAGRLVGYARQLLRVTVDIVPKLRLITFVPRTPEEIVTEPDLPAIGVIVGRLEVTKAHTAG